MHFKDIPTGLTFTYKGKLYTKLQSNFASPAENDAPPHLFIGIEDCNLGGRKTDEAEE